MIEEDEAASIDFGALRYAIERADPDLLLGFYAEDAELRIVHAGLPEGKAFELRDRAQIKRYLHAICEQEMDCSVEGGALHGVRRRRGVVAEALGEHLISRVRGR